MTFDSERELVDELLNKPIRPELLLAIAPMLPPRLMPTAGFALTRLLLERHDLIVHAQLPTRLIEAAFDAARKLPVEDRAFVLGLLGQRLHEPGRGLVLAEDVERIGQMVQQVPIERRVDLVERFLDRLVAHETTPRE